MSQPKSTALAARRQNSPGVLVAGALAAALAAGAMIVAPATLVRAESQSSLVTPVPGAPVSFADLVDRVKGSVVSIHVANGESATPSNAPGGNPRNMFPDLPKDHPLNEFFKRFRPDGAPQGPRSGPRRGPSLAQGSGFVISADGYVVTNNHVVDEASKVEVSFDDREKIEAEIIGTDSRTDLALLKIKDAKNLPYVEFAPGEVRVGEWVVAIGNPFGLGGTVTAGIVSAKSRDINAGPYDYLQIDAAVNRGNSGGPAFNMSGEVVGVNTAIFSPSGGNVGIAFAVPAKLASEVVEQLKSKGSVSRGWLGVHIQNITEDIAASLEMKEAAGALVSKITPKGPSDGSQLKVGDAIVSVNDEPIADSRDLARKIADLSPGTDAQIIVWRDGAQQTISVKLGEFPSGKQLASLERGDDSTQPKTTSLDELGLTVVPASEAGAEDLVGVVITGVEADSVASETGLQVGDVILKVDLKEVETPEDVSRLVADAKERNKTAITLFIKRGNDERFVGMAMPKG